MKLLIALLAVSLLVFGCVQTSGPGPDSDLSPPNDLEGSSFSNAELDQFDSELAELEAGVDDLESASELETDPFSEEDFQ